MDFFWLEVAARAVGFLRGGGIYKWNKVRAGMIHRFVHLKRRILSVYLEVNLPDLEVILRAACACLHRDLFGIGVFLQR